jgi:hypothetical protein
LPADLVGAPPVAFETQGDFAGQGSLAFDSIRDTNGVWQAVTPPAESGVTGSTFVSDSPDAGFTLPFNGQEVKIIHSVGPDHGQWEVLLDGEPALDDDGAPLVINAFSPTARWDVSAAVRAETVGEHTLTVRSTGASDPASTGRLMAIARVEVQPPERQQSLPFILLVIAGVQAAAAVFALVFGRFFEGAAAKLNTKRSIMLALLIYSVIAAWGFFVDSTVEFWLLAWMVAIVQGGSQALSRSLFSSMSPREKSGEFFGLYGIMEKFSSILGPLIFAGAVAIFGSSRPAILSLIAFFIIGGWLLARVNVPEGQRVAKEEDAAVLRTQGLVT